MLELLWARTGWSSGLLSAFTCMFATLLLLVLLFLFFFLEASKFCGFLDGPTVSSSAFLFLGLLLPEASWTLVLGSIGTINVIQLHIYSYINLLSSSRSFFLMTESQICFLTISKIIKYFSNKNTQNCENVKTANTCAFWHTEKDNPLPLLVVASFDSFLFLLLCVFWGALNRVGSSGSSSAFLFLGVGPDGSWTLLPASAGKINLVRTTVLSCIFNT